MTSRRRTTSNKRWNNVVYANVEITTSNNVESTLCVSKIKYWFKIKIIFLTFKECLTQNLLHFFPILRGICKRIFAEPQKFLKHRIYWITKSIFKPSHFVKHQLVFNFKRQVQAHYIIVVFIWYVSFKCVRKS